MNRRHFLAAGLAMVPVAALANEGDKRKKGGGASFIQIDTITATVMRMNGRRGTMTVETGVDVPDATLHARAEASTPRLMAAFSDTVRTYAAGLPAGAVPNADYLSRELQRQADAVLGKPGAKLLLGTIIVN